MKLRLFLVCLALTAALLANSPLHADSVPISILNPSFEDVSSFTYTCAGAGCQYNSGSITDWTLTGEGGSWQPGSNSLYFTTPIPDGSTIAWVSGGTISQDLGVSLLPNSIYILSVFVGDRADGVSGSYSIAMAAGATTLDSLTGSSSNIGLGSFGDLILTFATGQNPVLGDLSIVLGNPGGQADFDNVTLTVGQNTAVPEPTSLILLIVGIAFVGLFSIMRRA